MKATQLSAVLFATFTGFVTVASQAGDLPAAYRCVYKTVYDEQPVTAYRLTYETVFEDRQVTTMKPEWVTEQRQRTYRVAKPVMETSTRQEVYRVMRPVIETETRQQRYTVRRPVCETVMQNQNYVTCEPVTTTRTECVDQGGYVDQCVYMPGAVRNRLQWLPGTCAVDPRTGTQVYQRGGLHWVPTQEPGSYTTMRQYVPNIVQRQVPQTTYVQKVVTQQVPVQVTRYVDEVVEQPVQCQVQKWVTEEVTRPITTTACRIEYEDRVENYNVQTCRWVSEVGTVRVPHTVAKWQPYTTTRLVPRTVVEHVPVDPCVCGPTTSYSPIVMPPAPVASQKVVTEPKSAPANPAPANEPTPAERSVLPIAPGTETEAKDSTKTGQPALEKVPEANGPANNADPSAGGPKA